MTLKNISSKFLEKTLICWQKAQKSNPGKNPDEFLLKLALTRA